jgi:hypothetical protein
MTAIVICVLIIILTILASIVYQSNDKLSFYKLRIDKAEQQIETELDHRYEIVKEIQKTIEKSTKKELKIYKDLDELKNKKTISTIEYDKLLNELIEMIYLIETDYPKISKKKDFKETIVKLNESNTIIQADKTFYNDNNKEIVNLLKKFPTSIIGKLRNIKINPYYEIREINEDE